MWVFPKNGIPLTNSVTLEYESLEDFFGNNTKETPTIEDSLFAVVGIDSVALRDSLDRVAQIHQERVTSIQHASSQQSSLALFYNALSKLKAEGGKVRILHYGDSQIEGDRMTRYIRNKFQKEFGGNGPGLVPAYQVIPTGAVHQYKSDNWLRYTAYGNKDTTLQHKNYGLLASFSRFNPPPDSIENSDTLTAWLEIQPATFGYSHLKTFSQMSMLLGGNTKPVEISITVDSSVLVFKETLKANTFNRKLIVKFNKTPSSVLITFKGLDSPNVYSLSFEGKSGIIVDNIPLRGSSGTLFRRINKELLIRQYANEPIKLVILQFGGNSIPYTNSKKQAEKIGNYLRSNIHYLKSILPNASFLVIGPSDMSTKIKSEFVTYPILEFVRDQVQKAAHAEGAAYYDMYEVMGGKNSMPSWVTAEPPLAGPDYVHFTTKGAAKMAALFYTALKKDYEKYLEAQLPSLTPDSTTHAN